MARDPLDAFYLVEFGSFETKQLAIAELQGAPQEFVSREASGCRIVVYDSPMIGPNAGRHQLYLSVDALVFARWLGISLPMPAAVPKNLIPDDFGMVLGMSSDSLHRPEAD